jgi:malate dehydrogenase
LTLTFLAGYEFAEYVLQAAFQGKKTKTVQAYINLSADAGGEQVKKEIGADLEYFSVNIELGVSNPFAYVERD